MSDVVKLGDVVSEYSERNKSLSCNHVYSVTNSHGFIPSTDFFSKEVYSKDISTYKIVKPGMLAYNPSRINVGSISYLSEEFDVVVSPLYVVFLPDTTRIIPQYINYYLHSSFGLTQIKFYTVGSVRDSLHYSALEKIKIPLPTVPEQQHIVSVLDNVNSLIDVRKKQIALLDEAEKSLFVEMFGDPVENPKGWDILSFSDIAVFDTRMTTDFEKYADVPHIGIENIESVTGRLVNYKLVKDSNLISGKYVFTPKHIIYSKIRPNLNKVAIPNFDGLCSADAYPILPKDNCLKDFLVFILRSKFFISFILRQSDRANIPKVNKKQIQEFKMPLPPLSLQKEFAARISAIEDRRREMDAGLQQMEEARSALMQEYFG